MTAHLRYLRYVLLHKWYVLYAGVIVGGLHPLWLWRLLVHDLSKFRPSEWRPYVAKFYGEPARRVAEREIAAHEARFGEPPAMTTAEHLIDRERAVARRATEIHAERERRFNVAWVKHQHRNAHHWQHWVLVEDSGKTIVLVAPPEDAREMLADWLAAGTKILRHPSMAECVAETIAWYVKASPAMLLRQPVREWVERSLHALAVEYGVLGWAQTLDDATARRRTVTLPTGQGA
jgi:hypothetical protein